MSRILFSTIDSSFYVGSNTKALRRFARPSLENPGSLNTLHEINDVHDASIYCLDISPNGQFIATGSNDKIVKILTFDQDREEPLRIVSEMTNHDGTIRSVRFLPGNNDMPSILASGGAGDGRIYLTDVNTDNVLVYVQPSDRGVVTDIAPVNRELMYAASGSKVIQWDIRERYSTVLDIALPVQSLSCGPGSSFLATGCENGNVAFWDIRNTTLPIYQQKAHNKAVRSIAMKGNWLLAGSMDSSISLHNLQKQQNLVTIECRDRVISVDLDPQIEAAVSNQADGSCCFWDISFD